MLMDRHQIDQVPQVLTDPLKAFVSRFQEIEQMAKDCLANGPAPDLDFKDEGSCRSRVFEPAAHRSYTATSRSKYNLI